MHFETKFCLALAAVGLLTAGLGYKSKPVTLKEVIKPNVTLTTTLQQAQLKTYPISNLNVDASQVIYFDAEVSTESVELTIARLRDLDTQKKDVYLVLASPGGSVFDGSRLIAYIEGSKVKINTLTYATCASMCAQIFAHGNIRYMVDHSTLMYHQAAGGVEGSFKEMASRLNYVTLEVAKLDAFVANRAGISREVFDRMVEHELWIAADDAIDKHLADKLAIISVKDSTGEVFSVSNELKKRYTNIKHNVQVINPLQKVY